MRSTHEGIGRYIDDMYGPCAVSGDPAVWYSIIDGMPGRWSHALFHDDRCLTESDRGAYVLNYLTWHVNQGVVATSEAYVLLHAAAAARDGVGVLLPAAMEAGKTTLVAGLVRAGFNYLTDEAAAIHPGTLAVEPFPKPLSIDQGSWSVLSDLEPHVDSSTMAYLSEQWHVPPRVVRDDAISGPVPVGSIVFPSYVVGAQTVLAPMRRAEALLAMLSQTFRFHEHGRRNLEVLAQLLEGVSCYRLVSGDLDEAVARVQAVVEDAAAASVAGGRSR